jgi:hypothetical protein
MSRPPARVVIALVLGLLAVVACERGSSTPAPTGTAGTALPTTSVAATPTAAPAATAAATASPSTSALPPAASLAAEGGDAVVGQLGSFTWGDGGSDSPWLPGAPIAVGAGEPLAVTFADPTPTGPWTAVRAPADATSGAGAVAVGAGAGRVAFAIAAPGRWTVAVTVAFIGGGSAAWYWLVTVT